MQKWLDHKAVHVALILIVFSCTGLTVARLGVWITGSLGVPRFGFWYWMIWIVGLLPLYNVLLLIYAFIFGKFQYFRTKQKKTLRRMMFWRKRG